MKTRFRQHRKTRQHRTAGRLRMYGAIGAAVLVMAAASACGGSSGAPTSSPTTSPAATGGQQSPSGSDTPSPRPSISRDQYTSGFAAGVLKSYLNALVAKDPEAICALSSSTSPANPKRISQADCVRMVKARISGEDWTGVQVDCWASAKDLAACAGMTPNATHARTNELENFVFDSKDKGFAFADGIPEGCDPKNTTGCWFVVVYDSDGVVSVSAHWGERVYR